MYTKGYSAENPDGSLAGFKAGRHLQYGYAEPTRSSMLAVRHFGIYDLP